jgi:diguanylate cyclase (GGDEF)-like protein/PAS domain S-box-containing protein
LNISCLPIAAMLILCRQSERYKNIMFPRFFSEILSGVPEVRRQKKRKKAMKPMGAITALALFALALFGSGAFLHGAKTTPAAEKELHKPLSSVRRTKNKPAAAVPPKSALGTISENSLAFPLMLAGGTGLLAAALAGLGFCRSLSKSPRSSSISDPSSALTPASSQTPARFAGRMREAERLAHAKQREDFEAQQAALQAELSEARQRKAETEALRDQVSRQFQEFFRTLPVPCFCFAANGQIIRWNAACETLYGIPAAAALDSTLWDTIVPDSEREEAEANISRVLAGTSLLGTERWDRLAGGVLTRLRCSMVPLRDAEGQIIGGLSAGVDITDYAGQAEQIAVLTAALEAAQARIIPTKPIFAPDTGPEIAGHPAFRARLAEEVERAARYHAPLSLVVLDLDGFTARNQTLGFEAGDLALQSAVAVIKSKMRTVDVIARLGADDYAVILPETGEAGARIASERLRAGLAEAGGQNSQTACFGVVQLSPDISGPEELVCRALAALTCAQSCGANTVVHYQDMPQKAHKPEAR